jgi:hypothetical protein
MRTLLSALVALLVGLTLMIPSDALAQAKKQSVATLIKAGQKHFDEQQYEESIQTLSAALMRPGIASEEKIKVFQILAYNYIVLNRADEGEGAVFGLLAQDPDYALPETESPRFRDFFEKSGEKWEELGRPGFKDKEATIAPVKIKHSAPAQVEAGLAVSLSGSIDDPEGEVAKVLLYYRASSADKFDKAKVKYAMRKFTVDIPAGAVEPPLVEYYIEALNNKGLPLATRGDAAGPLRIAVPEGGSVFTSPWFWIPVGIVVVAAVIIPIVLVSTAGNDEATVRISVFETQ